MNASTFYQPPLAQVHHRDFGQYARQAAEMLLQMPEMQSPRRILDLGCGSGITARLLSEAGHRVTGIDYSAAMVEIARTNAPLARFVQASAFDLAAIREELRDVDAVLAIGEVLNYLFDEKSGPNALENLLQALHAQLNPGGFLLFDLLHVGTMKGNNPALRMVENDQWSMFLKIEEEGRVLTREISLFTREGELHRRSHEVHRQRLYEEEEVLGLLEGMGFEVETVGKYGDLAFRQGHQGYLARKG